MDTVDAGVGGFSNCNSNHPRLFLEIPLANTGLTSSLTLGDDRPGSDKDAICARLACRYIFPLATWN